MKSGWDIFFPERGDRRTARRARTICLACPVMMECLAAGLYERDGMWGSTTFTERRKIIKLVESGTGLTDALQEVRQ